MRYETSSDIHGKLLILKLSGQVAYNELMACFREMDEILRYNFHLKLLIDGSQIECINISNSVCQQMAPSLLSFARRAAFFSDSPLVFGMARVIQTYSFNDNFGVFRHLEDALHFVEAERDSAHLMCR